MDDVGNIEVFLPYQMRHLFKIVNIALVIILCLDEMQENTMFCANEPLIGQNLSIKI